MRKYLLLGIPGFLLIATLFTIVLQRNNQTTVNSRAAGSTIDTLPYLLGKHSLGQSSDPQNNGITNYVVGNSVFYVKSGNGRQYEYRTWDANYIYLVHDTSVGGVEVGGTQPNSYKFAPGRGIWMKRQMAIGESIDVVPGITWFKDCTQVGAWPDWRYTITLEAHKTLDVGGSLGNQDVIVLKYDYQSGYEKFYYSKDWGWVRWEEFDAGNNLKRSGNFNKIDNVLLPLKASCGIPQPNITIPTQSPTPRPSQTSTPVPSQTLTPVPTQPTGGLSCPNPDNQACYDCNEDDAVNIFDFSCFSKNYGKEV